MHLIEVHWLNVPDYSFWLQFYHRSHLYFVPFEMWLKDCGHPLGKAMFVMDGIAAFQQAISIPIKIKRFMFVSAIPTIHTYHLQSQSTKCDRKNITKSQYLCVQFVPSFFFLFLPLFLLFCLFHKAMIRVSGSRLTGLWKIDLIWKEHRL